MLVHDQRVAGRLADQRHPDLDGDLLAAADEDQVDMLERVLDRITLDGLRQRQRLGAVADLDGEQLVGATVTDRGGELARGERDVLGLLAVAVQHGGHQAGTAGTPGTTLAELGAGLGADLYLGHGETPGRSYSGCASVGGAGRGARGAGSPEHRVDHGASAAGLGHSGRGAPSPWQPARLAG